MKIYSIDSIPIGLLKKTQLFSGINEADIPIMLKCLETKLVKFDKEEYVIRIGERFSSIALLLDGRIHIRRDDYWGNRSILNEIYIGEVFGEAYAIPGIDTTNTGLLANDVVAVEESLVLLIDINHILTVCTSSCPFHLSLIHNLFSLIAEKNRNLTQKLGHMSKRTTREKLLSYLSEQQLKAGTNEFTIPFNRQQLADFLSVDRSAMSNELSKMRDEGIINFDRSRFELKQSAISD